MLKGLIKSNITDLDGSGIVTVAANAFNNIDADGDISMPGSFTKTIKESFYRVKWFKNHNRDELIGVPLEAKESNEFLIVRGRINMNKQLGRDIYSDYKIYAEEGLSLEHSIGVDAIRKEDDHENKVRKVMEWKWWEFSTLTSWGANPNTPLLELKSFEPLQLKADLGLLELKLRKGNYTDETCIELEKSIARIKSLLNQEEVLKQPVPIDVLKDVSRQFINSLQIS
jgi:HK97 family phage prohead protease